MESVTLNVQGMTCGGCVVSVRRVLERVPGVSDLAVEVGEARMKIDDAVVTQQKHIATSEEALAIERTRLLLASRDKLVLEKLAASYRSVELKAEERRDQSVLDDLGARAHRERQTQDSP